MNFIPDTAAYLRRRVVEALSQIGVNSYFVAWLLPEMVDVKALKENAQAISARMLGAQRTYQDVAALGFALECGLLDSNEIEKLREGLRWMTGRTTHVDGYVADFCTDAVSLLGISLGLRRLNDRIASPEWLLTTCQVPTLRPRDWQASLISLAHRISGSSAGEIASEEVRLVAFSKGLIESGPDADAVQRISERLRATQISQVSDAEVPIRLAALGSWKLSPREFQSITRQ